MNFESPETKKEENNEIEAQKDIKVLEDFFEIETRVEKDEGGNEIEKNIVRIGGVPFESYASKEDIKETLSEIWPVEDNLKMLQQMAVNMSLNRGLIIEGGTGVGKTFCVNKFTELVFGRGNKPVDFYCNGETSTFELLAKYVPNTENPEDLKNWEEYLKTETGKKDLNQLEEKINEGGLKEEELKELINEIIKKAGIKSNVSSWKFQLGALPRAMIMPKDKSKPISENNPSRGTILHIQEVGLAQAEIINSLLQLGGEAGKISKDINIWENGGRKIEAGPDFWIVYSTNPPESFNSRQAIDQALLRRNTYLNIGQKKPDVQDESIEEHLSAVTQGGDTFKDFKERKPELYNYILKNNKEVVTSNKLEIKNSKIPVEISDLLIELRSHYITWIKTALNANALNSDRIQKIEFTVDHKITANHFISRFYNSDNLEEIIDKSFEMFFMDSFAGEDREKVYEAYERYKEQLKFSERLEKIINEKGEEEKKEEKAKPSHVLGEIDSVKNNIDEIVKELNKLN